MPEYTTGNATGNRCKNRMPLYCLSNSQERLVVYQIHEFFESAQPRLLGELLIPGDALSYFPRSGPCPLASSAVAPKPAAEPVIAPIPAGEDRYLVNALAVF